MTVKKTAKKLSKEEKADQITKLASEALTPVVNIVKNMTDALKGTINLSLEVLAGFKNYATIWTTNTDKPIQEIVSDFRDGIYIECLFLTPSQKTVAYNNEKMALLQFHKLPKERAKYKHYKKCIATHPDDTGEGNIGVPPRQLRDLFYIINQIPVLMAYNDSRGDLKGDYSTVTGIPDQLGTIRSDKTAMNAQKKKQNDMDKKADDLATKIGTALIKIQNSFDNFQEMIKDCHTVIEISKDQNNVAKIVRSASKKMDDDLVKLNEFLKDSLATKTPKQLKGAYKLIVERSEIVDIQKTTERINTIASEPKQLANNKNN